MIHFKDLKRVVNLNHNGHSVSIAVQMFWNLAVDQELDYCTEYNSQVEKPYDLLQEFLTNNKDFRIFQYTYIPNPKANSYRPKSFEVLLVSDSYNSVISIESDTYHRIRASVASKSLAITDKIYKMLVAAFPEKVIEPKSKRLKMDFWYMSNRPTSVQREITVPDWEDVKDNYTSQIQTEVEKLLKLKDPANESKLLILNGKPGCGKTYLLRTLLWEWRSWAKADFVLDPESMFARPDYLLRLVLDDDDEDDDEPSMSYSSFDELLSGSQSKSEREGKWRIIILEDADNFISSSAKVENGQSMARLLNILDGLVGQGLKILFIITANEDEQKIHEAIKRPGRCLANLTFEGLSKQQALEWLAARGLDETHLPEVSSKAVGFRSDEGYYTLAQLYHTVKLHKAEVEENAS